MLRRTTLAAASLLTAGGGVHRLAIDAGGGSGRIGFLGAADFGTKGIVNAFPCAILLPRLEVAPDGAFGRKILGQVSPGATGSQDVENGIHDITHVRCARSSASGSRGQKWFDQRPLGIRHVAGVG